MEQIIWIFVWLVTAYLVGQVAYAKGRKDKWDELSKEYICLHKSVVVNKVKVREHLKKDIERAERREKLKEILDNRRKKKYNKKSYSSKK